MRVSRRVFTGTIAVAALCDGCAARSPAELSPADVVAKASAALAAVKSVHFKLTSTGGMMAIGSGLAAGSIEGDVLRPDRLKGTAVSSFGKLTIDLGFMVVGTHQYITNPISKQWEEVPTPVTAPNLLDPQRGAPALLKQVTNLKRLADASIGGVACYHLSGKIAASLIAGLVGAAGSTNLLDGELWVGTTDFLTRQIHLIGPIATNEPPGIERTLILSSFNETLTIDAPV
ncbi:MAG: LppX_LprAFG lipoprotein [Chloroflexota bacterium]